jgi:hypothetical protein
MPDVEEEVDGGRHPLPLTSLAAASIAADDDDDEFLPTVESANRHGNDERSTMCKFKKKFVWFWRCGKSSKDISSLHIFPKDIFLE